MKKETFRSDPNNIFLLKRDPLQMYAPGKPGKIVSEHEENLRKESQFAEVNLQTLICKWLRDEYEGLLFFSDTFAGIKLSPFLKNLRSSQSCKREYPDLTIMKTAPVPFGADNNSFNFYAGLVIEIKVSPVTMKDGVTLLKDEHILAQYQVIKDFRKMGYAACFGCGEGDIKAIARVYMRGEYKQVQYLEREFVSKQERLADLFLEGHGL